MIYTGETDDQVFNHQSNSFETLLHEHDPAMRACIKRLRESLDVILQVEQLSKTNELHTTHLKQEWFRPVLQAAPVESALVTPDVANPGQTMSPEGIDHNISNIERQFSTTDNDTPDLSGLDSALTTAQLTELMEREQL